MLKQLLLRQDNTSVIRYHGRKAFLGRIHTAVFDGSQALLALLLGLTWRTLKKMFIREVTRLDVFDLLQASQDALLYCLKPRFVLRM